MSARIPSRRALGRPRRAVLAGLVAAAALGGGGGRRPDEEGLLRRVNAEVNRTIRYEAEPPGRDVVRFGPARGDCEDYAETKRLRLAAAGWPRRDLRVERVSLRDGDCHAVLVATDARGRRWVLDNRVSGIETVEQTGRRYDWDGCAGRGRRR